MTQEQNVTVVMAFSTNQDLNQLTVTQRVKIVNDLTDLAGGVTTTEHLEGYRMDDGSNAVEYSYTFDLYGVDADTEQKLLSYFENLKELNNQESIIYNGALMF